MKKENLSGLLFDGKEPINHSSTVLEPEEKII